MKQPIIKRWCFPLVTATLIAFVLSCVVVVTLVMKENKISMQPRDAATLHDLDQIEKNLQEVAKLQAKSMELYTFNRRTRRQEKKTVEAAASSMPVPASLPDRLSTVLTEQQLDEHYRSINKQEIMQAWFSAAYINIGTGVKRLDNKDAVPKPQALSMLALRKKQMGEWEAARWCYWQIIDHYQHEDAMACRSALGDLAWLETDPVIAARMVSISCHSENVYPMFAANNLMNAYFLCKETGSDVLAEFYLAKLYAECPSEAKQFGEMGLIPEEMPQKKNTLSDKEDAMEIIKAAP